MLNYLPYSPLVCDNHRIHNHRVFAGMAQRSQGSLGWFYGFKLHLVVNDGGELLACQIMMIESRCQPYPDACLAS